MLLRCNADPQAIHYSPYEHLPGPRAQRVWDGLTRESTTLPDGTRIGPGSELIVDWHELDIALCQMCDFMPIMDVIDRFESGGQLTQWQWRFEEDVRVFYFHAEDVVRRALALGPGLMCLAGPGASFQWLATCALTTRR
jgi:hypothetical protein